MSTPELSARAEEAVSIAVEAGRKLGLTVDQPRVLHDVFNVLVHLAPSPVVVRVPTLLKLSLEEHSAKQRDELAVAGWLMDRGVPVVAPSPLVPREPVLCRGRSLTFWEFVNENKEAEEPEAQLERFTAQAADAAELHAHLAEFPGELPFLLPVAPAVGQALADLRKHRTELPTVLPLPDLERAEREYAVVAAVLGDFARYFPEAPIQALHGDSPAYNMMRTVDGMLFSDFEEVTAGPVEWDLVLAGPDAVDRYERAAGRLIDAKLLDLMERARMLQVVGVLSLTDLMPEMGPALAPMIDQWRSLPELNLAEFTG